MFPNAVMVVFSSPEGGREAEYNDWYENEHLPDLLSVPGIANARRYTRSASQVAGSDPKAAPYLALYEIDAQRVDEVLAEVTARAGTDAMRVSRSMVLRGDGSPVAIVYEATAAMSEAEVEGP